MSIAMPCLRGLASFTLLTLVCTTPTLWGQAVPSGGKPSPRFGAQPFTQKLLLAEEFGTQPIPSTEPAANAGLPLPPTCEGFPDSAALDEFLGLPLWPLPTRTSNVLLQNAWKARIAEELERPVDYAPREGRPPGEGWAHQRYEEFKPEEYFQAIQTGARTNRGARNSAQRHHYSVGEFAPGGLYHNTAGTAGFDGTTQGVSVRFHPNMPVQDPHALWTFDGTLPVKLLQVRYGTPLLFRHHNALPVDPAANMGFGCHTITTHEHNGHNPSESDGYIHSFFFPGQFYDFRWPLILAGHDTVNVGANDPRAGAPDGAGGIRKLRGDWRETASSHWFHDHMLDFTAQNVYKGNAALMNYYSSVDRGNEAINDGVNLRLPSGTALDWGNRDYDVNLLLADKAWDQNGQLWYNPFQTDGFLGDTVTVNWQYAPYLDVRARRYRFRLLNGCVSRFFKLALVKADGTPVAFHLVANDGNIMEHAVAFDGTLGTKKGILPTMAIAERYDIVIDFAQFSPGQKLYLVNILEHTSGAKPEREIALGDVLNNTYKPVAVDDNGDGILDRWNGGDPCVGKVLELRVKSYAGVDLSMNPKDYVAGRSKMIPLPRPSAAELAAAPHHTFEFGRSGGSDAQPWTIRTDGGDALTANYRTIAAAPNLGGLTTAGLGHLQVWKLRSSGNWAHPVHVHFEEGIVLSRDGSMPPEWERWARKDVYRIGTAPDTTNEIEIAVRFREFAGSYVEHCHNTTHEDTAMLLRWDLETPGQLSLMPSPVPSWEGCLTVPSQSLPLARIGDRQGPADPTPNNGTIPPTGNITVELAEYRTNSNEWRLKGKLNGTSGPLWVRAYVGPTLAGALIGSDDIDADGRFEIRTNGPAPGTATKVSFDSTSGAVLLNITFVRRS